MPSASAQEQALKNSKVVTNSKADVKDGLSYTNNTLQTSLSIGSITRSGGAWNALFVEQYDQGNTELCWAVTTWTMGRFILKDHDALTPVAKSYTPSTIAISQKPEDYTGGTIFNAQDALLECYGIEGRIANGTLTMQQIEDEIDNYRPIYSAWNNDDNSYGHAVCIQGYGYNTYTSGCLVSVMESLKEGNYKEIYQANNKYKFTYNNKNYTWTNSMVAINTDSLD